MFIYQDAEKGHALTRTYKGKHRSLYAMTLGGWYAGGFSAKSDTEALRVFRLVMSREEAAAV